MLRTVPLLALLSPSAHATRVDRGVVAEKRLTLRLEEEPTTDVLVAILGKFERATAASMYLRWDDAMVECGDGSGIVDVVALDADPLSPSDVWSDGIAASDSFTRPAAFRISLAAGEPPCEVVLTLRAFAELDVASTETDHLLLEVLSVGGQRP